MSPLICKFQELPIKIELVTQMTKSNRGVFSNQGDVTLRFMIQSGQFTNLSESSSMFTLSAGFMNTRFKLN